jgi:hypothetical protein
MDSGLASSVRPGMTLDGSHCIKDVPAQPLARPREATVHASVTDARRMEQQITIVAARSPIVAKNDF